MKLPPSVYFLAAFTVAALIYLRYIDDDPTPSVLRVAAYLGKRFLSYVNTKCAASLNSRRLVALTAGLSAFHQNYAFYLSFICL